MPSVWWKASLEFRQVVGAPLEKPKVTGTPAPRTGPTLRNESNAPPLSASWGYR